MLLFFLFQIIFWSLMKTSRLACPFRFSTKKINFAKMKHTTNWINQTCLMNATHHGAPFHKAIWPIKNSKKMGISCAKQTFLLEGMKIAISVLPSMETNTSNDTWSCVNDDLPTLAYHKFQAEKKNLCLILTISNHPMQKKRLHYMKTW